MHEAVVEQLETKIAFLERAHGELSDALIQQQRDIQALNARLAQVAERLAALLADAAPAPDRDERPPHY